MDIMVINRTQLYTLGYVFSINPAKRLKMHQACLNIILRTGHLEWAAVESWYHSVNYDKRITRQEYI